MNEKMDECRSNGEPAGFGAKGDYQTPELTVHGTLEDLTHGTGDGDADVGYGSVPW